MRDILPDASIGITVPASQFFDGITKIVGAGHQLSANLDTTTLSMFGQSILNIGFKGETLHDGLFGQMIAGDNDERVQLEVRAERWQNDDRPGYETYVEAIHTVFRNLLRAYNQEHQSRYRLTIASREACEPVLSPRAQEAFDTFLTMANRNGLHPLDWKRFYRFCHVCHVYRVHTNEVDLQRILVKAGFSEGYARELAGIYSHLRSYSQIC